MEAMIENEDTIQQQQLTELQVKVEGLRIDPVKEDIVPIDLEKTPEFEAWKSAKIQESLNYLRGNWKMDITVEKLVIREDFLGFPDYENRRAYSAVWSYNYTNPLTGEVIINPATGRQMHYKIWRKIDPPATEPAPTEG